MLHVAASCRETTLPLYTCYTRDGERLPAEVWYSREVSEVNRRVLMLKGPLGFDMEWCSPSKHSDVQSKTSLIQLADAESVLLIQVGAMLELPQAIQTVLEDKGIVKVGVNIKVDALKINREYGVFPKHMIDLSALAKLVDPERWLNGPSNIGLKALCETYLHRSLPKGAVRLSDWNGPLDDEQRTYAANDAHCSLNVYHALLRLQSPSALSRTSYVLDVDDLIVRRAETKRTKQRSRRLKRLLSNCDEP